MKQIAFYTIPMDPRTKKNSQMIAGTGPRCPKCGKRQKQFIRQGHANTRYSADAARYLFPKPAAPIPGPVHMPDVQSGMTLTNAYRKLENARKDEEISQLKRQLEAEKKNSKNRANSPGSQKDAGGKTAKSDFDEFAEAFR